MIIPVTLITGFLGSGKTTLLNHLLRDPGMADTAVIINEFGDVAIDHLLVESAIENAVVLQSGCICCTVRGDLVDTLADLKAKAARGALPPFSRIAVETTGLADPTSLVRIFASEPALAGEFTLRAVVTTVDAVNAPGQLDQFEEAKRQVALADVLILTKTDLASPETVAVLSARLHGLNPAAQIVPVQQGAISPAELFERVPQTPSSSGEGVLRWLGGEAFAGAHHHDHSHHDETIRAFAVTLPDPIEAAQFRQWLTSILSLRGKDLLRMKGIVHLRGKPGPLVIHAVQDIVHPPVALDAWPDDDHSTRIVFITRNIPQEALQRSLELLNAP